MTLVLILVTNSYFCWFQFFWLEFEIIVTTDMEFVKYFTQVRFLKFSILHKKNAQIATFVAKCWEYRMFYSSILIKLSDFFQIAPINTKSLQLCHLWQIPCLRNYYCSPTEIFSRKSNFPWNVESCVCFNTRNHTHDS